MIVVGVTLTMWLVAGLDMTRRINEVERQTAAINQRYERAQEALSDVRAQVLLASVVVRDALLDPDPQATPTYLLRFEEIFGRADLQLRQYVPVVDNAVERQGLLALRRGVDEFHTAMVDIFTTGAEDWPRDSLLLLEARVGPARQAVLGVSEQVTRMNRSAFVQRQFETANLLKLAQQGGWVRLGVALGASFLIGALAILYAGRLEKRLREQRVHDLRITDDLHRLSARLATAQEDERRSIARELHDEVGQSLTAIKVELSLAQRTSGVPPSVTTRLEDARLMAESTMQTIRDLSQLLHPPLLDDLGLGPALEHQLEAFTKHHGVRAEVLNELIEERLAPEVEVALYRIVQEALTNVAKHAHASTCRVCLRGRGTTVRVTIDDDGSGFDTTEVERQGNRRGLGLISIRERAEQLGGTFELETGPGQGTRLTIEMPARPGARPVAETGKQPEPRHREAIENGVREELIDG